MTRPSSVPSFTHVPRGHPDNANASFSADQAPGTPDEKTMQEGIALFLQGAGVDRTDPNLADTPQRVVRAWVDEFLCGYQMVPAEILQARFPAPGDGPVIVTNLKFVSVCPHHLLPYSGMAHVAYVPEDGVVGLSQLSRLIACHSRRLILQETLTLQVADSLMVHLGARGAACVFTSRQACMALRGVREDEHQCVTSIFLGAFEQDRSLQQLFIKALPPLEAPLPEPGAKGA